MAEGIKSFEGLVAWQKARILARDVYVLTRSPHFAKDFGLSSQVQRAAVSTMADLAEGFERRRRADFHRYVEISKASCAEVLSHLYAAFDVGHIDQPRCGELREPPRDVSRILGGLRASLERPADDGPPSRASGLGPPVS